MKHILLAILLVSSICANASAGEKAWQISVENRNYMSIDRDNLGSTLKSASNTSNSVGLALNMAMLQIGKSSTNSTKEAQNWILQHLSGLNFLLGYGKSDLEFQYTYANGSQKYSVPNSTYVAYEIGCAFLLTKSWEIEFVSRIDEGIITKTPISFSKYYWANNPQKVKGSWSTLNSKIGMIYHQHSVDYLFGIEGLDKRLSLTYSDYSLSTPGTEKSVYERYSDAIAYIGFNYSFIENIFVEGRYFLPFEKWGKGYTLNLGWRF